MMRQLAKVCQEWRQNKTTTAEQIQKLRLESHCGARTRETTPLVVVFLPFGHAYWGDRLVYIICTVFGLFLCYVHFV